jgi:hypothetical protein
MDEDENACLMMIGESTPALSDFAFNKTTTAAGCEQRLGENDASPDKAAS